MGNVKARGVGEMTWSMGVVVVSGAATATLRALLGGGEFNGASERAREKLSKYSQCAGVSRVRIAGMMRLCSLFLARAREAEWRKYNCDRGRGRDG